MSSQPRQPKGQPSGGEFSTKYQSEDELDTLSHGREADSRIVCGACSASAETCFKLSMWKQRRCCLGCSHEHSFPQTPPDGADLNDRERTQLVGMVTDLAAQLGSDWVVVLHYDQNTLQAYHTHERDMFVRVKKTDNSSLTDVLGGMWVISSHSQWDGLQFVQASNDLKLDDVVSAAHEVHLSCGSVGV